MANPLRTRAGFEWFDQARGLVFTWSGESTDSVKVTDRTAQKKHAEIAVPDVARHAMAMTDLRGALDIFELACAAWRPDALTESLILGYDPVAEQVRYMRLRETVAAAERAGDDVTFDHKNAVFEAAQELVEVRR